MKTSCHFRKQSGIPLRKYRWLWPLAGLAALIWVLVRVIPKPSRIAYPCMQASAPIATGFIAWIIGIFGAQL